MLDPTVGGRTAKSVLKWCCKKGIEKVCWINLHDRWRFNIIPGINPFLYNKEQGSLIKSAKLKKASIVSIADTVDILFQVKDRAGTSFINRYLPALLNCLYEAQAPLYEARYFTNRLYLRQRAELLSYLDEFDPDRKDLEEVFGGNIRQYEHFQTTINRIRYFFRDPLSLVFGVDKGVDFMKLVAEKWVILVNLDTSQDIDVMDARLLGTMVLNQVLLAHERLIDRIEEQTNGKKKSRRYYIYIDEAGEYATYKLARSLELFGKRGLRFTIGHQHFGQFQDDYILNSVMELTHTKAMFNLPGREDRDKITHMFYGGDIPEREASWANADLPKQEAVIKAGKFPPQRVRIPDVKDVELTEGGLERYVRKLYEQPWYYNPRDILEKQKVNSIYDTPVRDEPPRKRKVADRKTASNTKKRPPSIFD